MKTLRDVDPIAADEWYYTLNGDMTPDNVAGKSAKWAYFQCSDNPKHIFHRRIFSTLDESGKHKGCPFCIGKEVFPGENDFLSVCKEAKEMWDYEKNSVDPAKLLPNSKIEAYFRCKYGHSFYIPVYIFKRRPFCRLCRKDQNSLLAATPSVADIWDYEKNGDDRPENHWKTDPDLVWWKCKKCGYEWQAKISTKHVNKSLCPVCEVGKRFKKNINDLLTKFPDVTLDWNYSKNKDIGPDDVTPRSIKKVWWKCHICGYEWKTAINVHIVVENDTLHFRKCPVCMGRIALSGINDLATTHPSLAKEYVPELNTIPLSSIRAGSPRKITWRCQKCHQVFTTSPENRIQKSSRGGCPYCSGRYPIPNVTDFASQYPHIALEWDYDKNQKRPEDYTYGSTYNAFWKCRENPMHKWKALINDRKPGFKRCPYCNDPETILDLAVTKPKLVKYWDYIKNDFGPENYTEFSNQMVYWKCKKGHSFQNKICNYLDHDFKCHICNNSNIVEYSTELEILYPDLIRELDITKSNVKPIQLEVNSDDLIWWICPDERHSYQMSVYSRTRLGRSCPECRSLISHKEDITLLSRYPEIIEIWDYNNNDGLLPEDIAFSSKATFNYVCNENHKWNESLPSLIQNNFTCAYCSGRRLLPGYNSVADKYPALLNEWNTKNLYNSDMLLYTSKVIISWICQRCGMSYYSGLDDKINGVSKCPHCSGRKVVPGRTSFKALYPELMMEYSSDNVQNPDELVPSYTISVKWYCSKCSMEWEASIRDRVNGEVDCPYCNGRKAIPGRTSFKALYPELMMEYSSDNVQNPDELVPSYTLLMKWNCSKCSMEWEASIRDRVNGEVDCPYCSGRKAIPGRTSLKALYPELMKEWKYISNLLIVNPDFVLPSSTKESWWECERCNKSYTIKIKDKVNMFKRHKESCPYCKGYRRIKRRYF